MSTRQNARFQVVGETWEENQQRSLAFDTFLEQFLTRLERLNNAKESIELQAAHNQEARMRLRKEGLQEAAYAHANDGIIRLMLPDESDPVVKLIDSAIDFFNQLRAVAEERPAIHPDITKTGDLADVLAINPVIIRSALSGITWPLDDKLNQLISVAHDYNSLNNMEEIEDDENEKPNNPA